MTTPILSIKDFPEFGRLYPAQHLAASNASTLSSREMARAIKTREFLPSFTTALHARKSKADSSAPYNAFIKTLNKEYKPTLALAASFVTPGLGAKFYLEIGTAVHLRAEEIAEGYEITPIHNALALRYAAAVELFFEENAVITASTEETVYANLGNGAELAGTLDWSGLVAGIEGKTCIDFKTGAGLDFGHGILQGFLQCMGSGAENFILLHLLANGTYRKHEFFFGSSGDLSPLGEMVRTAAQNQYWAWWDQKISSIDTKFSSGSMSIKTQFASFTEEAHMKTTKPIIITPIKSTEICHLACNESNGTIICNKQHPKIALKELKYSGPVIMAAPDF